MASAGQSEYCDCTLVVITVLITLPYYSPHDMAKGEESELGCMCVVFISLFVWKCLLNILLPKLYDGTSP